MNKAILILLGLNLLVWGFILYQDITHPLKIVETLICPGAC